MLLSTVRKFALSAALALGASQALAADITIRHPQGETKLAETPKKVVTFDLAALDTMDALGVPVAGVPKALMPDYLQKYVTGPVPKVGTLFEPDYEAIAELQPDLIIVTARSASKFKELSAIAPTVDMSVDGNDFLKQSEANIRTLAKVFNKESEANRLIEKLNSSTAELKQKTKNAGKGLLVLTTGGKMSTYGPGSRFGVLFSDYGMTPADATIKADNHGQPISYEYILEKNPDWLFVIDRDASIGNKGEAASKLLDNDIVRRTTAWQKGHVVYLDGLSLYVVGGGLTALQNTVDQLNTALAKP